MNIRRFSRTKRVLALSALAALPAFGQVAQDRPDLCGKPNIGTPVPDNVSAVSSPGSHTELAVRLSASTAKIPMPGVIRVDQVCPLEGNRLLVFATRGAGDSDIFIVSGTTGAVLDSFLVQSPALSPDQRWLAMRDWITPTSQIPVTEQYLLYDLTKDAAGNRSFPGVDARTVKRYGRTMYPVTPGRVPFENHGVREDQVHSFGGGVFLWAADSKSVVFTDRTDAGLTVILVIIEGSDLTTLLHPVSADGVYGILSEASVTMAREDLLEVRATFRAEGPTPYTKSITLHRGDFQLAKVEEFVPPPKKPSVRK